MIYPKPINNEHIIFLQIEFNMTITNSNELDDLDDELFDEIFDKLCNIEIKEACNSKGTELSERGRLASDIVTYMGGPFEPDEDWVGYDNANDKK